MKWTLIFFLGGPLAETTLGWTYHYSKTVMNWTQARQWCQTYYTDMVVIQNQKENDYLVSLLPNKTKSPYYWIGITKNHKNETWTWVGNNSTWIGEQSWAANEPNNNYSNEFCVEIYVNKGGNRGKWNDEKCINQKHTACYKAQCNATICGRGICQETMENITCLCYPGFEGDRCQTAVECPPLSQPNAYHNCTGGNQMFNSTCHFKCNPGFLMIGSPNVTCGITGGWSGPGPVCETVECPPLSQPNAYHNCTGGNQTFNSTCHFKCNPGFLMIGSPNVTCGITGTWSGARPVCETVECPPLSQPNAYHNCTGGKQTFNSTCHFKCNLGFLMIGSPNVTCGITGAWSGPRPVCESYKQALLAVAGCGAVTASCCICFCWMKRRKRKKLAQERQPEEVTSPSSEVQG